MRYYPNYDIDREDLRAMWPLIVALLLILLVATAPGLLPIGRGQRSFLLLATWSLALTLNLSTPGPRWANRLVLFLAAVIVPFTLYGACVYPW